jgi:hypothetical protein
VPPPTVNAKLYERRRLVSVPVRPYNFWNALLVGTHRGQARRFCVFGHVSNFNDGDVFRATAPWTVRLGTRRTRKQYARNYNKNDQYYACKKHDNVRVHFRL